MYNTNKIESILFDMDGTVLDSEKLFAKAELSLVREYGMQAELDDFIQFRGMSEEAFYPAFIARFNIKEDINILRFKLKDYLFTIMKTDLEYINGFVDFYEDTVVAYNMKTALVTNTSREIINHVSQCIDLDRYFDIKITSSDVVEPKPSAVPYNEAMDRLSVTSSGCAIIEDSSSGLQSAISSGAEVIGITTTLSKKEIAEISSDIHVFDSYAEIKKFLIPYL